MTTTVALCAEILDCEGFLVARGRGGADVTNIATNLANTLAQKVLRLSVFGPSEARQISESLNAVSFNGGCLAIITEAVDARLKSIHLGKVSDKAFPQYLINQLYWFTAGDWLIFNDPNKTWDSKADRLAYRLSVRCGCTQPHEQTIKWAVTTLALAHYTVYPSYGAIFNHVKNLKQTFEAVKRPFPHGHIVQFPKQPIDLPVAWFQSAYDEADPPITALQDQHQTIGNNHVPLRKNSKLLAVMKVTHEPVVSADSPLTMNMLRDYMDRREARCGNVPITYSRDGRGARRAPPEFPLTDEPHDSGEDGGVSTPPPPRQHRALPWYGSDRGSATGSALARAESVTSHGTPSPCTGPTGRAVPGVPALSGGHIMPALGPSAPVSPALAAIARGDRIRVTSDDEDGLENHDKDLPNTATIAEYESSALAAMQAKSIRKKAEQVVLARAKAAAKAAAASVMAAHAAPSGAHVVPPAAVAHGKRICGKTAPAVAVGSMSAPPVPKKRAKTVPALDPNIEGQPPMPLIVGDTEPPVRLYNGGRIYTKLKIKAYRIIRTDCLYATEKRMRWSGDRPTQANWEAAMAAIDEFRGMGL